MRRLLKLTLLVAALAAWPSLLAAQDVLGCYSGLAGQGGQNVFVNGIQAAQTVVVTYPGATVNVFNHGMLTLATIFQDGAGTIPITQPWTSSLTDASAFWCAADGFYDVQYSNAGISVPFTISDIHIAFSSGGGGGGGGITTVNTPTGSGLTNSITGSALTLAIASAGCPVGGTQIWNGTAFTCGSPSSWSSLTPPTANLILPLSNAGIAYTSTLTCGDFGLTPTSGCLTFTTGSTSTTDTTPVVSITTGNNAFSNPVFGVSLTTGGSTFAQFQVCNNGSSHLGFVAIGNSITCPNLSISPVSKFWSMDNSPGHVQATYYQNSTAATNPMLRLHTATPSASAPPYIVACAGATPNADGSCPSSNYVAQWLGNGTMQAFNFQNIAGTGIPLNGILLTGAPSTINQCPTSTSTTTATWQNCGSGGGGGGGSGVFPQTPYYTATNTLGAFGPGITGQLVTSQGASSAPAYLSQGVGGATKSGGTYGVQCDSGTTTIDRLTTLLATFSGTTTWTIPDAGTTGCSANFTFAIAVATGTTVTVNRTTSSTFTTITGSAYNAGLTTLTLTAGQYATFSSPDNANYLVRIVNGGAGSNTAWSNLQNPSGTLNLSMAGNASVFNFTSALANAFSWLNVTPATLSTPQSSPALSIGGQYWTGAASAADQWTLSDVIAAGTNGSSTLTMTQSGSSGVAAFSIPNLIVTAVAAHATLVGEGPGIVVGKAPGTSGNCYVSNGAAADPTFQTCPAGATAFPVTVSGGVSGGIPYFSSTTVESASPILNTNILVKGGGAGAAPTNSSISDNGTAVTTPEGVVLSGASGAATTISTTTSNASLFLTPNGTGSVVLPNGTATNPSFSFAASASFGFYSASATNIGLGIGAAHDSHNFTTGGLTRILSGGAFCFSSSAVDATTACDTGVSRSAAAVVAMGNGTAGDTTARVKAAAYMSVGTTFTTNAGCSETTLVGGASVGSFVLGANSCSVVVTFGNSATAPHGWSCWANDLTNATGIGGSTGIRQSATGVSTATFAFGSVPQVSDVINFGCLGY